MEETIIISLGGSMIVPEDIDVKFLEDFRNVLRAHPNYKFIIAPGGGKTARKYANALKSLGNEKSDDSDWLGIYTIKLNAMLLSFVFQELKNVEVIKNPDAKPGQTSDSHAVGYAKNSGAKKIINISNIDYVYDKNPNEHADAQPLEKVSWEDFRKIVGSKWEANASWPFDPVASEEAEKLGITVVFMNGRPVDNLAKYLSNKPFLGTVIS